MKTQIISLQSHDDLISVRDRMSWAKSPRILLVWPRFERITLRPLDLRILQQHAEYLGADLGLVTRSGSVRRNAEGFGIPVFRSTTSAQREPWSSRPPARAARRRTPVRQGGELRAAKAAIRRREPAWSSTALARIGFFLLGVLAVLSLAAVFVPTATITLSPRRQTQETSLPAEVGAMGRSTIVTTSLPAQQLKVTVDATRSGMIASRAAVPQTKARGVAHFQNLTQMALVIPAGTVVYNPSPSGVRYATVNETRLEGVPKSFVEVPIEALIGGEAGNTAADTIQGIEGSLALSASVTNPEAVSGGMDREMTVPSVSDRERLRTTVLETLGQNAQGKVKASLAPGDLLLEPTLKMSNVVEETYDPPAGEPGSRLSLTMRAEYQVQYVKAEDLQRFAEAGLNSSMPSGFKPVAGTLKINLVQQPEMDPSGRIRLTLDARRDIVRTVDPFRANVLVRGLKPDSASARLQSELPLDGPPKIDLSPRWWPWLPLIPIRISVSIT
jgi:Baseplate J-like protein